MGRRPGSKNKPKLFDGNAHGIGHNSGLRDSVDADELRGYIARIEEVNAIIKEHTSDRKEIFTELKANGYGAAAVREIIRRRAMAPEKRSMMDELMDQYMAALGDFVSSPLGEAGAQRIKDEVLDA